MTDRELMDALSAGDQSAGRYFVDTYQLLIYNTCFGFLRNVHNAEDLTQDILMEVLRNASKFRGEAKISTWLYRISINRSLNFIRNNRKRNFWKEIDGLFGGDADRESTSYEPKVEDQPMETAEQHDLLEEAIASLPENQRVAFSLNKQEELPYAEVAEIMQMSLSAVESLIHRAKLNLRKKLKNHYQ